LGGVGGLLGGPADWGGGGEGVEPPPPLYATGPKGPERLWASIGTGSFAGSNTDGFEGGHSPLSSIEVKKWSCLFLLHILSWLAQGNLAFK